MNRNTQIGILVAVVVLAVGGWFVYDMYITKNSPIVTSPNDQNPDTITPTSTNDASKPYTVGEIRHINQLFISDLDEILKKALEVKTINDSEKNILYTIYRISKEDVAYIPTTSTIILKTSFIRNDQPFIVYFDTQIKDVNRIGSISLEGSNIIITCADATLDKECAYQIQFSQQIPDNFATRDSISVLRLISPSISQKYDNIVKQLSTSLKNIGISNEYKNVTLHGFDRGIRYEMTFDSKPGYTLFIMSPDFALGMGEGTPTSFTPNEINFDTDIENLRSQLIQSKGEYKNGTAPYLQEHIQYSEKVSKNDLNAFALFTYCGYAESNYCVQILTKSKENTGYLVHIDIEDTYRNNPKTGVQSMINSDVVKGIFSTILK